MLIKDFLKKECIKIYLESEDKESLMKELVDLHLHQLPEIDPEEALKGIKERESVMSTGIGNGVAIPHARLAGCHDITLSFGILRKPIEYQSIDKKPVKIAFLVFFPKNEVTLQLRFLARISRLLHHETLRQDLENCQSADQVLETIRSFEENQCHQL